MSGDHISDRNFSDERIWPHQKLLDQRDRSAEALTKHPERSARYAGLARDVSHIEFELLQRGLLASDDALQLFATAPVAAK